MKSVTENKLITSTKEKKEKRKGKIDGIIIPSLSTKPIICYVDDHQSGSYIYILNLLLSWTERVKFNVINI